MSELEDLSLHVHNQVSSLRRMLDLSAAELPHNKINKLGQELFVLETLLEQLDHCVEQQRRQLEHLKEVEHLLQKDAKDIHHMKDNIPTHMPRRKDPAQGLEIVVDSEAADVQLIQPETVRRTNRSHTREVEVITRQEFDGIPQYMKGRVTYEQMNVAVQSINTSVKAKYKILNQSLKTLSNHGRKLQQRFKEQETGDTKGQFFVVEDDIREFTQTKVDKRFQGILNMLRHCKRLRELRGGGLTRYVLL
ncbi:SKA complex subunit 1 [Echeneis naucrates]|uniref:SKA complex subunit 1 n=1 Tax=Echeneis naucrates TaxID=173247 RepID=A0A665UYT5_ECHNA|nr:spindle and kinetochore-associated protein 1 [Echeneis naucrates]